jgi:hypothetical protein
MNGAHLHLLVNHIPVLGAFGLLLLFAIAFARRDSSLARLTLVLSVALAAASAGVFLTGEPAEEAVEHLAGAAENAVEPHEDAALIATVAFGLFGAAALVALVGFRRRPMPRWVAGSALIGILVVSGLMGWTANLGGRIRHTEMSAGAGAPRGEWSDGEDHDDDPPSRRDR